MNELQEFFKQAKIEKQKALEKKRIAEEWERKLTPQLSFESADLGGFFGAVKAAKKEHVLVVREETSKLSALQTFFTRLEKFEKNLDGQIKTQKVTPKLEVVEEQPVEQPVQEASANMDNVSNFADAISNIVKKTGKPVDVKEVSDLEKLRLEFRHFKDMVIRQMSSIGGGGEVNLLKLDDVDTSQLGDGKFLVYNASSGKIGFTDTIDGGTG